MNFEVRRKDAGGRIGKLEIGDHVVETPTILPVVNPNLQEISADELREMGAEILITNAYIIYKNPDLRKKAKEMGLHGLLGFDGPIMTDSGAYQLSVYGDVDVSSEEIIEFQKEIGSDIIVPLDIPSSPNSSKEKAEKELDKTMRRLKGIGFDENNFAGPIQGSIFPELRKKSAKAVSDLGFDLYCIGGVVPMMETYDFNNLSKSIIYSKKNIPPNSPVHLFGAGHPMTFALATLLGCDLFDSAAYVLFAKRDKYLTPRGTWDVKEINYLPCSCPICNENETEDLEKEEKKLALHNLYVTFEEIRRIKEAIRRGELFELVSERSRTHPKLLSGLKLALEKGKEYLSELTPVTKKSAFFYQGEESIDRPEVNRNKKKLREMDFDSNKLLITPKDFEINEKLGVQVIKVNPPFVYPKELERTYPFGQSLIPEINDVIRKNKAIEIINEFLDNKKEFFDEIRVVGFEIKGIKKINKKRAKKEYSKN